MARTITIVMQVLNLISTPTFSNEVLWMARAIEGEMGGCFKEKQEWDIAWAIGITILNRVKDPGHPDTIEGVVRNGFYGYKHVSDPSSSSYNSARSVFVVYATAGLPPRPNPMFMFSKQDCERLGFDTSKADLSFENGKWGLYFFEEYPQ
jgi:hypothetical protein